MQLQKKHLLLKTLSDLLKFLKSEFLETKSELH